MSEKMFYGRVLLSSLGIQKFPMITTTTEANIKAAFRSPT